MIDRVMLYDIIYALAARNGREQVLFGSCAPLAHEALSRSLAGPDLPEIWFEIPLKGDPWFDLHALTDCETLQPGMTFVPETTGGYPEVFEWFATKEGVRQLALSFDVSGGDIDNPPIQLLVKGADSAVVCEFLEVAGRADATDGYRSFVRRLPEGWFACYTGVFPKRLQEDFRVECIVPAETQRAYVEEPAILEWQLRQVGLSEFGNTLISRCRTLADTPFKLEFQFNVHPDGRLDEYLAASVRFDVPPGSADWAAFDPRGAGGALMRQIETWGLSDDRWKLLSEASFAQRVQLGDEALVIYNYAAFLKLRWRGGEPEDAKVYFKAGVDRVLS